jgi:hypothetical protein
MTTHVAPAAMSTASLARPLRLMVPTVRSAPAAWVNAETKLLVVPSSIRAYPRMKQAAQIASCPIRATGAVGARSASFLS